MNTLNTLNNLNTMNSITTNKNPQWKTIWWLIKREFWENKGMLLWTPLTVGILSVGFFLARTIHLAGSTRVSFIDTNKNAIEHWISVGAPITVLANLGEYTVILFSLFALVTALYLMNALHSDRQDRSIFWWKSLPISDAQTVMSKIIVSIVITPFIFFIITILTYALYKLIYGIISIAYGHPLVISLFINPQFGTDILQLLSLYPLFILWTLPSMAWLLMISSWTKSRVAPWAFGAPFMLIIGSVVIKHWLNAPWSDAFVSKYIFSRTLLGTVPGSWLVIQDKVESIKISLLEQLSNSATLVYSSPHVWWGVAAGIFMLYMAIRFRRYRELNI